MFKLASDRAALLQAVLQCSPYSMVHRSVELIQMKTAHLISNGSQFRGDVSCAMGSDAGKRDRSW